LGLGYEACASVAPGLVWVGISGYGPDGPYRDKKAYDMLIQAEAGVVSLTGTPEARAKVGISIADIAAGHYAYSSVLAALIQRARTGRGTRIDISMLECLVEWITPQLYVQLGTGRAPVRAGLRHNMIVPYGAYHCADGEVMFAVQSDREFRRLCEVVLERPELADDPRYAGNPDRLENRNQLEPLIEAILGGLPVGVVVDRLEQGGIANAVVNDLAAVATHPQLRARGRWTELESFRGPFPGLVPPHNLAGVTPRMDRVPALGEHTEAVLAELERPARHP
jgi:crotonobetainyl-CoA:carnitine CoA-transferase CaiB-like acyl-CoA transferase